mmetsp:Transcript_40627/g.115020  ORF Transcript_40627/g.115020 Transcript_40627/m.115020 type:complete len:658 (-) Transcript_40627:264-2237(-)
MASRGGSSLLGGVYDLPPAFFQRIESAAAATHGAHGGQLASPSASGGNSSNGGKRDWGSEELPPTHPVLRSADADTADQAEPSEASDVVQAGRATAYWSQAGATCLACGVGTDSPGFELPEEQREHFKSDWHRCNLKRKVGGKRPLSEPEFEQLLADGGDEVESISGSDTDSDADEAESATDAHRSAVVGPKVVFSCNDGTLFAVWRCLLEEPGRADRGAADSGSHVQAMLRVREAVGMKRWMVALASGGHFAGAIFQWREGKARAGAQQLAPASLEAVVHKTFHRYVVRAKAGGRQSAKDATGKSIKSAGSALRRANEAALAKDIRATLNSWAQQISQASLIFVHASRADTGTLFLGADAPLSRSDPRVRRIPFPTRRPTLAEAKRVVTSLANVWNVEPADQPAELLATWKEQTAGGSRGAELAPEGEPLPTVSEERPNDDVGEPAASLQKGGIVAEAAGSIEPLVADSELHKAAKAGNREKVRELLEAGADPCQADSRGWAPYLVALDKPTRDAFRRFMAAEPDRWDYSAAGIPSALTEELEEQQAARRAEKEAKRKEKERERRKAAKERKKAVEAEAKAAAEAEVEAAAAAAAAAAAKLKLGPGDKKKKGSSSASSKKVGSAADEATRRREQMAAAAEARMKALQAASQQQKLW